MENKGAFRFVGTALLGLSVASACSTTGSEEASTGSDSIEASEASNDQDAETQIVVPRKVFDSNELRLSVTGHWRLVGSAGLPVIPTETNVVRILCYQPSDSPSTVCSETVAYLDTESDVPIMEVLTEDYQTLSVSEGEIRAVSSGTVADIEILISLPDESVEKSVREKDAMGGDTQNSTALGVWILE